MKTEINNSLKFLTCGSVDDGKSTLIGRMLYDSGSVYEDHINDAIKSSKLPNGQIDYSLFVDGLLSEREQGITIDVAYRYFNTNKTKFIVADSPGHKQYTRNMAVAASNSEAAILLIDAFRGIQEQTLRHSFVLNMFGIRDVIIAINKIDKVEYSKQVFDDIVANYKNTTNGFFFEKIFFIPVSAINGDNIVHKSEKTPWYNGLSLLENLELIASLHNNNDISVNRMLVQNSIRTENYGRGYQVQVSDGIFSIGDDVQILPSGKSSKIKALIHSAKEVQTVKKDYSATVFLQDELDVSRGCIISTPMQNIGVISSNSFWADTIFFEDINARGEYIFSVHHASIRGMFTEFEYSINFDTLTKDASNLDAKENRVLSTKIELATVVAFDLYNHDKKSGSFIVIDPTTNRTVAAGIIKKQSEGLQKGVHQETRYIEFIHKMKNLFAEYNDIASKI